LKIYTDCLNIFHSQELLLVSLETRVIWRRREHVDLSYALYCHVNPGCVHLSFVSYDLNNLVHSDYVLPPICHMPYIVMSFHDVFFYHTRPVFYYVLVIRIATTIRCVISFILSCQPLCFIDTSHVSYDLKIYTDCLNIFHSQELLLVSLETRVQYGGAESTSTP
jgi:hypothetical protein